MRLNELSPAKGSRPAGKRVARGAGSGVGKTGGRGVKGQKSRSGGKVRRGFEGGQMPLQRRLPKFGFASRKARLGAEVRLSALSALEGDAVDLEALKAAGLVPRRALQAKIILSGEIGRALKVSGVAATKGARAAIEAAGGSVAD